MDEDTKGKWTDEEHDSFLESLRLYGKDWNKIKEHTGTRSVANIRSHAQKFARKLTKMINEDRFPENYGADEAKFYV